MGDVVDVVGNSTEKVTARCAIDVPERQSIDLVFNGRTQSPHGSVNNPSKQEALEISHCGRAEIETDNDQKRSVQFREVDAGGCLNTADDDVGCVAEDLGADNRHHDADDGSTQHEDEAESFWPHPRNKSQGGVTEVF